MKPIKELIQKIKSDKWISEGKMKTIESELTNEMKFAFVEIANELCPGFEIRNELKQNLNDLCLYFLGIKGELSLDKGICLTGEYGTGKSTLMKIFQRWLAVCWPFNGNGFTITSIEEIIEYYKKDGNLYRFTFNRDQDGFPDIHHILINEFGKDLKDKIYGTEAIQILNSLMMIRYDIFQNSGKVTHLTSNMLPFSEDKALNDRYIEMFNVVKINGKSYRK